MPFIQRSRSASRWVLLIAALGLTPAYAQREPLAIKHPKLRDIRTEPLAITHPKPGDIRTVVTGRGEAASVAWPDGPASMTPRWLVSTVYVGWNCAGSKAVELVVKTDKGPGSTPRTFELLRTHGLQGGSTTVELYLWEVSGVKAACAKDGEVRVDSIPVNLTLRCEGGRVVENKQVLPLQVSCQPSSPSQEAVTGISGSETQRPQTPNTISMLLKFARQSPDPSPSKLSVGKASTLEFLPLLKRVWAPEILSLRVVRLDEKGQVAERFQPVPLSGSEDSAEFKPRLTFTPKAAGTMRFALEAEYADGSRLLTQPADVQVLTPEQEAAEKAKEVATPRRMRFFEELDDQMRVLDCGPKLVEWLKQQPIIKDAGTVDGDVWYRFTDERAGSVHCH